MSEIDGPIPPLPSASVGDHGHAIAKGAISAIPVIGGVAAELFGTFLAPPLTRRRDAWFTSLAEELERLRNSGAHLDLQSDEFVSAVLEATAIAAKTHQKTKLEALRNAVLNVAAGRGPTDYDRTVEFLRLIDNLSTMHLAVLKFANDPPGVFAAAGAPMNYHMSSSIHGVLTDSIPELRKDRDLTERVVSELSASRLISFDVRSLFTMMTSSGGFEKRSTPFGDELLRFIEKPSV